MLRTFQARLCLLIGKLLGRARRYDSALRCFKRAIDLCPDSLTVRCWIGWAYQQLENHTEAVAWFDRALQVKSTCAYAHAQMGRSSAFLGHYRQAVDELLRASRIDPQYQTRREYLLALGSAYSHLELMNESVDAHEKAYRLLPSDAEVVYCYGWALCASKRFAEAEPVLSKAVTLEPNQMDAHYNHGISLQGLDRWKEAASEFQEAIRLDPMSGDAHCSLGTAFKELQRFKDAADSLRQAIQISPDDPDAYVQIGTVYGELGQWQEALETGKRLRHLLPDHEIGYWLMSSAYAELNRYAEAIEVTEENLRHNPNSSPAIEGLGYIYLKSGRFADAIPVYTRAIAAHTGAAYLYAQLAEAYLGVGDTTAAATQQTLLTSLDESLAKELEERIRAKSSDAGASHLTS